MHLMASHDYPSSSNLAMILTFSFLKIDLGMGFITYTNPNEIIKSW